jgi:hypothetical protein
VRKRRERKQQAENLLLILALNEGAHSLPPQQLPRRRLIKSFDVVMISQVTHVPDSEPNDSPCVLPTWESRTTAAFPPTPSKPHQASLMEPVLATFGFVTPAFLSKHSQASAFLYLTTKCSKYCINTAAKMI